MEEQMQQVEVTLGNAGQRCNSRSLDRIYSNYVKLDKHWRARGSFFKKQLYVTRVVDLEDCRPRTLRVRITACCASELPNSPNPLVEKGGIFSTCFQGVGHLTTAPQSAVSIEEQAPIGGPRQRPIGITAQKASEPN